MEAFLYSFHSQVTLTESNHFDTEGKMLNEPWTYNPDIAASTYLTWLKRFICF
ncbi:MAG: hypothetical protein KA210_09905 [Bacteroidia bacterium]|nr:hypothetical protein [Bacteroidia bacterium]